MRPPIVPSHHVRYGETICFRVNKLTKVPQNWTKWVNVDLVSFFVVGERWTHQTHRLQQHAQVIRKVKAV